MVMSTVPSRRALLRAACFAGLALVTGTGVTACGSGSAGTGGGDEARVDVPRALMSTDSTLAAPMLGAFAGDLLREALTRSKGNLVLSPWSIMLAMGMNRAGASGHTAAQVDTALHAPAAPPGADNTILDNALNTAALVLDSHNKTYQAGVRKGDVVLRSAASTWAQSDVAWKEDYLATLGKYYGAGVRLTDFTADPERARRQINSWVAGQTEDRITDLVPEGALDTLTRLALVNALYLQAPWAEDFKAEATKAGTFTLADGTSKQVPLMHGHIGQATGFTGSGYQAVRLPYLGGTLAMTAVLPLPGQDAAVAAWLAGTGVAAVIAERGASDVEVTMPRFSFRSSLDLRGVLEALGVTDAFDPDRADYSRMTAAEKLYVSAALHEATIEVDEQGTVATAATAIVMGAAAAPLHPQVIVLDRPFFFVVHDVAAGIPIFVGRVADPTQPA